MKKVGVKILRGEKWQVERELMLKEGKVYVPKNEKLRIEIIWLHYNVLAAEDEEKWKITESLMRNYW